MNSRDIKITKNMKVNFMVRTCYTEPCVSAPFSYDLLIYCTHLLRRGVRNNSYKTTNRFYNWKKILQQTQVLQCTSSEIQTTTEIQINHQPDPTIFQCIILTFI